MSSLRSFVIEKLKASATNFYELLKTILQIGMQKIVVTDGTIETKLSILIHLMYRLQIIRVKQRIGELVAAFVVAMV